MWLCSLSGENLTPFYLRSVTSFALEKLKAPRSK